MRMIKILSKLSVLILDFLNDYIEFAKCSLKARYDIEEINFKENQVILRCKFSRSYIKCTIDDTISSVGIVEHLTSLQACWLGYYYASSQETNKNKNSGKKQVGFTLQMKKGRFMIVSLDHRSHMLSYVDIKNNRNYKEKITNVVQDKYILNNMDPTQACHIGMQAGFLVVKHGLEVLERKLGYPVLKIVK